VYVCAHLWLMIYFVEGLQAGVEGSPAAEEEVTSRFDRAACVKSR